MRVGTHGRAKQYTLGSESKAFSVEDQLNGTHLPRNPNLKEKKYGK